MGGGQEGKEEGGLPGEAGHDVQEHLHQLRLVLHRLTALCADGGVHHLTGQTRQQEVGRVEDEQEGVGEDDLAVPGREEGCTDVVDQVNHFHLVTQMSGVRSGKGSRWFRSFKISSCSRRSRNLKCPWGSRLSRNLLVPNGTRSFKEF